MEQRWHIPDPTSLAWESWGTEYSLFDCNTGETHLINELPAEVLRRLTHGAISTHALSQIIAVDCGIECTKDWQRKIERILQNLDGLGLIEQAPE